MKYPQNKTESLIPFEIPQTIEGGDTFFLYSKRYHEMYSHLYGESEKIKSSFINFIHKLSKSIDNEYLATVFKAVMLLYYDKFGENKIIEVATCVELIISEIRFKWGNKRPSPIRTETTLSKVKSNNLIPILLSSTITTHVLALLINEISPAKRETKESPTLIRYENKIKIFYRENKSKLKNELILDKVNYIYNLQ
jgi:hypothetical protein